MEQVRAADARGEPLLLLGGGSNLLVADQGFDGLVLAVRSRGLVQRSGLVEVQAGEPWDDFVSWCVGRGLSGVECLAGIPGTVGATPIQNVGAYGQEVADTIAWVRVWDREIMASAQLPAADCGFRYRSSVFKQRPQRYAVLAVAFALRPGPAAPPRYGALAEALQASGDRSLPGMREAVLRLRRRKSMVHDVDDPDSCSAGSFFTNPVVSEERAQQVLRLAGEESMPRFPAGPGQSKLAAAWLIERAGFQRGQRLGAAAISRKHCLAIVNRGGATAAEVLALAGAIREGVWRRFGVRLEPEPRLVGFSGVPWAVLT